MRGNRFRLGRRQVVEAVLITAATTAWVVLILLGIGSPPVAQAISNIGLVAASAGAGLCCVLRGMRSGPGERRVWTLLGLSMLSWGSGQVVWTWYESSGRDVPFPSVADVGYLGLIPLAAIALLSLPLAKNTMAGRIRTIVDGLIIAGSILLVSWVLVLDKVATAGGEDALARSISLAYPIGDVVVITIVLAVVLRARATLHRASIPLGLIGAGLSVFAIADSCFVYLTATGSYASGSVIDIGWFIGFTLVLVAARVPPRTIAASDDDVLSDTSISHLLPHIAVLVALLTTVNDFLRVGRVDSFVSWNRSFLLATLVIRQILTLRENQVLTTHLRARVQELTQRSADLRASEQRFEALVQHSSDVVTVVDVSGTVTYQSESVQRVFGYDAAEVVGSNLLELFPDEGHDRLLNALAGAAAGHEQVYVLELNVCHADGHLGVAEMTVTNLLENASVGGLVLNMRDVSERKVLEDQLVHEAFHDSLTALANRALFKDRVEHALAVGDAMSQTVAVLFLDLDGFKAVNDSLGHASGDLLLVQVGERLRTCVRPTDTVARLGGDEFAVLLEGTDEVNAVAVAERITAALEEPFVVAHRTIHVRGSLGIAAAGFDVKEADQLLRNADLAMYHAKGTGVGGVEYYDPEMHVTLLRRMQLEDDLRRALPAGELSLYYQPTVSLATGTIVGVEALVRWRHPVRGIVPPSEFIPLAEETGLIQQIGRFVLATACEQAAEWERQLPFPLTMNVNISGRQVASGDLLGEVEAELARTGLRADSLVLEMTESVLMEHTAENLALFRRIKALGVRLAIDDFGTGYSSLSYIQRFPVDILKIDGSFVDRLREPGHDPELIRAIVRLGQSLGMVTVAEGIEDRRQVEALQNVGCNLGQGYLFSVPLPGDKLTALLWEGRTGGTDDARWEGPALYAGSA